MKTLFFFLFLSLSFTAQEIQLGQKPLYNREISLPIYYFPFYDSLQIIEVDYYSQSVKQGALNDMRYPRGGSYLHDAMRFNRPNGYLIRNRSGEIVANYGVMNLKGLELSSPDSCETIPHLKRMNSIRNSGHHQYEKAIHELSGYGYPISRFFVPEQRTEMPEMGVELYGVMDTLGNIAIPMDNISIDYAHGEYLVHRFTGLHNNQGIYRISKAEPQERYIEPQKPFAIYDSTFQLTMEGADGPLQRLGKNCYAIIKQGDVSFIDRYGNPLHPNNYHSIHQLNYTDLILYSVYENNKLLHGLLSRQLEEVTPAIFSSVQPFQHGIMVRDRQQRNGYLNLQGEQVVPFELDSKTIDYRRDSFIVYTQYVEVQNGKMLCEGLIDKAGNILLPPVYWKIDHFNKGLARIQKDNKWGLINESGKIVCPIIYDNVGYLKRNFVEIIQDNKRGLVDRSGKVILEPKHTYVNWIDSMIHYGNDQDEYFIYNLQSGEKYKHNFGYLTPQENGLSFYKEEEKYGLVDDQGNLLISAKFEKVHAYRNNRAVVQLNGKFGLIDEYGKIILDIKYKNYGYDSDGNYELD
ncbi:MAG: hypothetical protein COA32_09010 [Fluviicola sp.]|nr:MAG: hypothetical protein COA32_09010 [Fluviicola sp.]